MVRRQRRARAERPKLYGEGSDGRERAPTVLLRGGRFVGVTSTSGDGLHDFIMRINRLLMRGCDCSWSNHGSNCFSQWSPDDGTLCFVIEQNVSG